MMLTYLTLKKDGSDLDNISCEEWIPKKGGKEAYEVLWKPLLITKFGDAYKEIPASWFWGRIHIRANSRKGLKEKLCYIKGSSQKLIDALKKDAKIMKGRVDNIQKQAIILDGMRIDCKNIIDTTHSKKRYKSVVCATLRLKNPLSKYYWLNISDGMIPFGGIIEHSNLIGTDEYDGTVVYLFNYVDKESDIYTTSDDNLMNLYVGGLKDIFPNFNKEDIISFDIHRDEYGTPIYELGYEKPLINPEKGLYICNKELLFPEDRNVSNAIKMAKKVVGEMK